jgi:glutathione S-transferase
MAPIFFDYERSPMGLKKVHMSLATFETYLKRANTKYAAGPNLTIADFPLVTAVMCLEAISFSIDNYPLIQTWYATFKKEYPELWAIAEEGMREVTEFEKNPPQLEMVHPLHPIRQVKK